MLQTVGGLGALSLATVTTEEVTASKPNERKKRIKGHIEPDTPNWVYVPFDVSDNVTELHVSYDYNKSQKNLLDIGIFDPSGYDRDNADGFRGWSGGERTEFMLSRSEATPGYYPGEIEAGTWNVILGPYRVGAKGIDYTIDVTFREGESDPAFEPTPASNDPLTDTAGWYRGDLHLHTVHSDGDYTPKDILDGARDNGLDFIVSTEHSTTTTSLVWGNYTRPDQRPLIIDGEEITTRAGHYNAIGLEPGQWIDWRYQPENDVLDRFVEEVHDVGGITVANHPFCPYKGCDWRFTYEHMDAIEVWNGPWSWEDEAALQTWDRMLRDGHVLPAVGGSDAHDPGDVIGLPQTVVRADRLGPDGLIAGLANGHAYIAESADVTVTLTATSTSQNASLGETLEVHPETPVNVTLEVTGASSAEATFHTQESIMKIVPIESKQQKTTYNTNAKATDFVRVEVRKQNGDMVALTNPIFLKSFC
ncbi:CehA/McbA family metallohydrolase [Haladaptatus caseinilyticus]|uniref:CehA/McbA family metallohydrolase n=1 Tax=Haladaptatus caseinilyticus TaxID=2993314 RepID=UPI00224B8F94|nr:CehA/McbA family metallohydrolase [Haladaptatus caseinilyticus]